MKVADKPAFQPCPEYQGPAVIVDVTPMKTYKTPWGDKEKFRVVYELPITRPDGARWCAWSMGFTPSWDDKANFSKFIYGLYGKVLTKKEREEFDTDELIGKQAFIVVTQTTKDGKTYANIASCTPLKGQTPVTPSGKYVRVQDRPQGDEKDSSYHKTEAPSAEDKEEVDVSWLKTKVHVGKHEGLELRELTEDAVQKLLDKWVPTFQANPKPSADDKRLMAALTQYVAYRDANLKKDQDNEPDDIPF